MINPTLLVIPIRTLLRVIVKQTYIVIEQCDSVRYYWQPATEVSAELLPEVIEAMKLAEMYQKRIAGNWLLRLWCGRVREQQCFAEKKQMADLDEFYCIKVPAHV